MAVRWRRWLLSAWLAGWMVAAVSQVGQRAEAVTFGWDTPLIFVAIIAVSAFLGYWSRP